MLRSVTFDSSDIDYDLVTALICFIVLNHSVGSSGFFTFVSFVAHCVYSIWHRWHMSLKKPSLVTLFQMKDGAILVFVPGWEQIRKVIDSLNSKTVFSSSKTYFFRHLKLFSFVNCLCSVTLTILRSANETE